MVTLEKSSEINILLDFSYGFCYPCGCDASRGFFFVCKNNAWTRKKVIQFKMEVEVVRVKITLACTECKQRNYNLTKDKRVHTERMETKKYCRFCKAHTLHKETK